MPFIIKTMQAEHGQSIPEQLLASRPGRWLKRFDPDAYDGRGLVEWTDDINQALKFVDVVDAGIFYHLQSKVRSLQEDGRPNQPLTAFTVTIERVK